jgi:hypothetical protein
MIYDMNSTADTKEEVVAAQQDARRLLRLWKKRSLYASGALLLSCASVSPFLYGHPLHSYWESFGKYLVLLSMALLIPFVICVGIAINSWTYLRNLGKIET